MISKFGFWPLEPMVGEKIILGVLAVAGAVFSLVMLVDCLKRPARKFPNPLTKNGEYDRLIWIAAIILSSLWFYFLGAMVYFFVVRRDKTEKAQKED
jgi:membrane associated rhomboid family serine protease